MGKKNRLEYEFLPDALEVVETPPSSASRFIIWLIFLLLISIVVWSCIGEVDEVAIARGKFISDGRTKVVQSLMDGLVLDIFVREGEIVKKEQLMFKLDSSINLFDIEVLKEELKAEKITFQIYSALLNKKAINADDKATLQSKAAIAKNNEYLQKENSLKTAITQSETLYNSEIVKSKKIVQEIEMLKKQATEMELLISKDNVEFLNYKKLKLNLEMLETEYRNLKILYDTGGLPKAELESAQNQINILKSEMETQKMKSDLEKLSLESKLNNLNMQIELSTNDIAIQESVIERAKTNIVSANDSLKEVDVARTREFSTTLSESKKIIIDLEARIDKINKSIEYSNVLAPIDGTVQSISQNTVGGIVTPAQVLATIVPSDTPLVIEAHLSNKDIGFVYVGQEVAVKFDTFSFQRYGVSNGKVIRISPDAFDIEGVGTVYLVYISLDKDYIDINGNEVKFAPGMTVTAEVKTGRKKIISFFLDPLIKYKDEGLKIR